MRQYALVISNHLNYTTKNGTQHNIYIYFAVGISISNIIYIHKIHYVLEEKLMGKKNIKWHHSCTATKHFNDSLYQVHCIELVRPKIARVFFSALRLTKLENFLKAIFDLSKREKKNTLSIDKIQSTLFLSTLLFFVLNSLFPQSWTKVLIFIIFRISLELVGLTIRMIYGDILHSRRKKQTTKTTQKFIIYI